MSEKRPSIDVHDGRVWISGHAVMTPEEAQAFALEIWRKAGYGPIDERQASQPVEVDGTEVSMRVSALPLPIKMTAMGAIYLGRELQGAAWRIADIQREAGRYALAEQINTALTGYEKLRANDRALELAAESDAYRGMSTAQILLAPDLKAMTPEQRAEWEKALSESSVGSSRHRLMAMPDPSTPQRVINAWARANLVHSQCAIYEAHGGHVMPGDRRRRITPLWCRGVAPFDDLDRVVTAGQTTENGPTEPRTGDHFTGLVPVELTYDSTPIHQMLPPLSAHSTREEWRRANELFRTAGRKAASVYCPVCRAELPVGGEAVGGQAAPIEVTEHDWTRPALSDPPVSRCPGSKALVWVDGSGRVEMSPMPTQEDCADGGRTD